VREPRWTVDDDYITGTPVYRDGCLVLTVLNGVPDRRQIAERIVTALNASEKKTRPRPEKSHA